MSDQALRRLLVLVLVLVVLCFIGGTVAAYLARTTAHGSSFGSSGFGVSLVFYTGLLSFPAVGALIVHRQPRNRIGWLLLAIGAIWGLDNLLTGFASWAWLLHHRFVSVAQVFIAIDQGLWVPAVGLIGIFLLLVFPNGALVSPRWRPVAWISAAGMVLAWTGTTFAPGDVVGSGFPVFRNPVGVTALKGPISALAWGVALIPSSILVSAASIVVRFRHSRGVERLQLKWLAGAAGAVAVISPLAVVSTLPAALANRAQPLWAELLQDAALFSLVLIPIAVGIAVLRYRLYDFDVVINKALVYGLLTGLLALLYAALVLAFGALARGLGSSSGSPLVLAASTLAAAALFRPLRRSVQSFIDRRFYRRKYDANRTLEAFSARLRDHVDLDELSTHLMQVVHDTLEPGQASLWLRQETFT